MTTMTTSNRTYKVTFSKVAPYPLNWDATAEEFASLDEAMAAAEAFMAKYPKGIAIRTRWVEVTSYAGIKNVGHGSSGYAYEVDRKIHFNSKRKAK
jgi:hypothetical protein